MLASAYERVLELNDTIVDMQLSAIKTMFNAINLWTCGTMGPCAPVMEKVCELYEVSVRSSTTMLIRASPATNRSSSRVDQVVTQEEQGPLTTENAIMPRATPDYSNLRAAVQDDHAQSIIDNDAYWNSGLQGSNAKSPNKMGTDRERTRFDQLLNNEE
jgi:hypothetical protein